MPYFPLREVLVKRGLNETVKCVSCGTALLYLTYPHGQPLSHWEVKRAGDQPIAMEIESLPPEIGEAILLCNRSGTATAWDRASEEVTIFSSLTPDDESDTAFLDDEALTNQGEIGFGDHTPDDSDYMDNDDDGEMRGHPLEFWERRDMELNADDEAHRRTHNSQG